jgi:hypothetical protein
MGLLYLLDKSGKTLSPSLSDRIKALRSEEIRILMQKKCDAVNRQIEALGEIHIYTPPPDAAPQFESERFTLQRPKQPVFKSAGFLGWFFRSLAQQVAHYNTQAKLRFEEESAEWEAAKAAHEAAQIDARSMFERVKMGDTGAMERLLEMKLAAIVWPCELLVTLDISSDGKTILMDTSLPELQDMPTNFALAPIKGMQLAITEIPTSQVRYLYMRLVHAIGFRLLGEVFANLQGVNQVLLSAYVPSTNEETGETTDQFTYSVAVRRAEWRRTSFSQIRGLDIVSAFSSFTLRRGMAKAGVFVPIAPYDKMPEQVAQSTVTAVHEALKAL